MENIYISNKEQFKDQIILIAIDIICDFYYVNHKINKNILKNKILSEFVKNDIINIDLNCNITDTKNKLLSYISNEVSTITNTDISIFNLPKNELIGSGSFSNVYKIFNNLDKQYYAIKKIGIINDNYNQHLFEIRSLALLNHENIIRYHTSWIENSDLNERLDYLFKEQKEVAYLLDKDESLSSNNNLIKSSEDIESINSIDSIYNENKFGQFFMIQMELCKCNLKQYLDVNDLSFNDKLNICLQIAKGIEYIHKNGIIHRDLKLQNIFLSFDNKVKIGDFGLATNVYNIDYNKVGTYGYIAPEVLNGGTHQFESDLYSLGVIFIDIFYKFKTNMERVLFIKNINVSKLSEHQDTTINKIIISVLDFDYTKRISLDEIIKILSSLQYIS
jgi:serine/threonine protein kinase